MADTRISKIQLRNGNFVDIPLLDTAEVGYATDNRRLFIGNPLQTAGTGNNSDTVFPISVDVTNPSILKVFLDGVEENAANYSTTTTSITFNTPPGNGVVITYKHLSEIELVRDATVAVNVLEYALSAGGVNLATGYSLDTTSYNVVVLDYTVHSTNGVRMGQIRMMSDGVNVGFDDNYTESAPVDIVFSGDGSVPNTLRLMYTDNDNLTATLKMTQQLWNSN